MQTKLKLVRASRLGRFAALMLLGVVSGLFAGRADAQTPAEARAMFLLNFAKFIEWPAEAFSADSTPLAITVLGDAEVARAAEKLAKGKNANGREIVVKAVSNPTEAAGAHIVFVGQANLASGLLAAVGTRPVVTVGEEESFLTSGGVIRLFADGNKVLCAINIKPRTPRA
jgi:hypothetical protein